MFISHAVSLFSAFQLWREVNSIPLNLQRYKKNNKIRAAPFRRQPKTILSTQYSTFSQLRRIHLMHQ